MNRSLIFCAIALVAVVTNSALAAVNVQLNLRYDDPANEAAGGTWELLAGSDAGGIAGFNVLLDNLYANDAANDGAFAGGTDFDVFQTVTRASGVTEIVIGSDIIVPSADIGLGNTTTGNVADDLFPGNSPLIWANNALLGSGTFGAERPSFLATSDTHAAGANDFDGGGAAVATTIGMMSVRGDGVATDELTLGDANRDGTTNINDFAILSNPANFNNSATGWDKGNFNSVDGTNINDFAILSNPANFGSSATPPAVSGLSPVPEPSSAALLIGLISLAGAGRKR